MVFQSKPSEQSFKSSIGIGILMDDIKPVITEKHAFECRDESILKALIGIFGLSGF